MTVTTLPLARILKFLGAILLFLCVLFLVIPELTHVVVILTFLAAGLFVLAEAVG